MIFNRRAVSTQQADCLPEPAPFSSIPPPAPSSMSLPMAPSIPTDRPPTDRRADFRTESAAVNDPNRPPREYSHIMSSHRHDFSRIRSFVLTLILALGSASAHAQVRNSTEARPTEDSPDVDRRLEPTPLRVEALGLTMHPPAGANVTAQRANNRVTIAISEPIANPRWSLSIQLMDSSLEQPTPARQVREHLDALETRGAPFTVLTNESRTINGVTGQLCYLRQTTSSDQQYITGWLILPAGRNVFLVAQLLTMPEHLEEFRPTLEASFETIEITSQEELSLRIRSRIEAGRKLLDSITAGDVRQAAQRFPTQWRRIYRPGDPDDNQPEQEIGYMRLEVTPGKRGLLNPGRTELEYDEAEHEVGLVVRANVRVLEGNDLRDVEMIYWMAWDQGEEAFSVRGTRRQGEATMSEAITGVRTRKRPGNLEPTLTVIMQSDYTRDREPLEWAVPDAYLSQALNYLLPMLLPKQSRTDDPSRTYSYYYFDMAKADPSLQRRVDTWQPAGDRRTAGRWTLTTRMGDAGTSMVSTYSADGQLIRRQHPDGAVTEPIELPELRQLWKRRGLPMNSDDINRGRGR